MRIEDCEVGVKVRDVKLRECEVVGTGKMRRCEDADVSYKMTGRRALLVSWFLGFFGSWVLGFVGL